jgi:hypothetical protein
MVVTFASCENTERPVGKSHNKSGTALAKQHLRKASGRHDWLRSERRPSTSSARCAARRHQQIRVRSASRAPIGN